MNTFKNNTATKFVSLSTPFAFPIMVDRLREKLSSEKLEDRIKKMKLQLVRE
ncbi:MAG TPA: hypothetical protein PKE68_15700 [Saprospiraceae bacterium]|nr:hypothetical protein [Saprospiraceae bacterium]